MFARKKNKNTMIHAAQVSGIRHLRLFWRKQNSNSSAPRGLLILSYHVGFLSVRRLCSPSLSGLSIVRASLISCPASITMCLVLNTMLNEWHAALVCIQRTQMCGALCIKYDHEVKQGRSHSHKCSLSLWRLKF